MSGPAIHSIEAVEPAKTGFLGGLGLLSYAIFRKDPVIITGHLFGILVYARNLILIYKKKRNE